MGIYLESSEAIAIKQFWFALYGIAMVITLIGYFRKQFVHNTAYRLHCRFCLVIIFLAASIHFAVANMVEGYSCNKSLWFSCDREHIALSVLLMITTTFGLATNKQNAANKGIEGLIVLMFVPALWFLFGLSDLLSPVLLKDSFPLQNEISLFIYMCLVPILLALVLQEIAKLVGFQEMLIKFSKIVLFWLTWLLNAIYAYSLLS